MRTTIATSLALILLGSAALVAQAQAPVQPTTAPSPTAPVAKKVMLEQDDALGILSVINQAEINAGKLATTRAESAGVKKYAQAMIKEHSDNQAKLTQWNADANHPAAKAKTEEAKAEAARLSALTGAAFDAAYIKAMVADHRKALMALDEKLIPAAKDAPVKAFLQDTRTHVAAHLKQAEALQAGVSAAGTRPAAATR